MTRRFVRFRRTYLQAANWPILSEVAIQATSLEVGLFFINNAIDVGEHFTLKISAIC